MLHAAAMLLGLTLVWILATQRFFGVEAIAIALGAVVVCILLAWRMGMGGAFARAPRSALAFVARSGAVFTGALGTMRAAIAADVTLRPALIRIKTRGTGAERAAFASLLSAAPGMVVVDTDADGFLAHVMDEDAVDAGDLGHLERVAGAQAEGTLR